MTAADACILAVVLRLTIAFFSARATHCGAEEFLHSEELPLTAEARVGFQHAFAS